MNKYEIALIALAVCCSAFAIIHGFIIVAEVAKKDHPNKKHLNK